MTLALVIAVVHGLSVEVEQMFVPSRFAEWRDVGNDVIGALGGLSPRGRGVNYSRNDL
jgi:VanZ family protein